MGQAMSLLRSGENEQAQSILEEIASNDNAANATEARYRLAAVHGFQAIGRPQVFGTQYKPDENRNATQEPYDRDLISDALRQELGVPSLEAQEERLDYFSELMKGADSE